MTRGYLVRTLLQFIPVLYIVSVIVFVLVYLTGDPVSLMVPEDATEADKEQLIRALGLDQPWYVQYGVYMRNLFTGDFGTSYRYGSSALPVVLERLPATLELTAGALVVAVLLGVPAGIYSAVRRETAGDVLISTVTVLGKAMPNFWLGIMLILLFSVTLRWLPVSGRGGIDHLILPALTLGTAFAAELTKMVRSSLLESLGQDYIRTALAKGVHPKIVVFKHALRNALLPVTTVTTLHVIGLLGGALVTETIFSWPGLGQLVVQAVYTKDMAVIQISVFVIAVLALVINLATDILYQFIDPRIRFHE